MWFRDMIKYCKYFSLYPFKKLISKPSDLCFSPFKAQTSLNVLILTSLPAGILLWMGDGWPTGLADLVTVLTSFTLSTVSWGLKNKVFLAVKKKKKRPLERVHKLDFTASDGQTPVGEKWRQNFSGPVFNWEQLRQLSWSSSREDYLSFESFYIIWGRLFFLSVFISSTQKSMVTIIPVSYTWRVFVQFSAFSFVFPFFPFLSYVYIYPPHPR